MPQFNPEQEDRFQEWYKIQAEKLGLNPNPDDPQHHYDYRSAFESGEGPDTGGHWPSKYKLPTHPNRFVFSETAEQPEPKYVDPFSGFNLTGGQNPLGRLVDEISGKKKSPRFRFSEPQLTTYQPTIVDKLKDYLGLDKPQPKATPIEIEAIETGESPYSIKEDIFGTGRTEEFMRVLERGLSTASFGATDLMDKYLKGKVDYPETIAGGIGGGLAELVGFIAGPYEAAKLITGTRLAPTATGLKQVAQILTAGGATLGISSGLSNIVPAILNNDRLSDMAAEIGTHAGLGAIVGAIFPATGFIPTKSLRMALGLAVLDKIHAGTNEWFTIDDYVKGIMDGSANPRDIAESTFTYLLDLYFLHHVPSMKAQLARLQAVKGIKEIADLSPDDIEQTILALREAKRIPGSQEGVDIPPTGQHLEMFPEEYPDIAAVANMYEGKVYKGKNPTDPHALIAMEHGLNPEKVTPGYETKDGRFIPVEKMEKAQKEARVEEEQASVGKYKTDLARLIDLPEMVQFAKDILGQTPEVWKKLRAMKGTALGLFDPKTGKIKLAADIFKDVKQASLTLAHEIGHAVDWLPDRYLSRGNLLGRIASLKKYMKDLLEESPGALGKALTEADKERLRKEARTELREKEKSDEEIVQEVVKEIPIYKTTGISHEMILDIWRDITAKTKYPDLYKIVAGLNSEQKKQVVKEALRGVVNEVFGGLGQRVQVGVERVTETIKAPRRPYTEEEIYERYREKLKEEILKRRLFEEHIIREELLALSEKWRPYDKENVSPSFRRYRESSVELYADALSILMNDPEALRREAPKFHDAFFNWLERKPEVERLYDELQNDIKSGTTDADAVKRLRDSWDEGDRKLYKKVQETESIPDQLKTFFVDIDNFISSRVRQVGEGNVPVERNPIYKLEEMRYRTGMAEAYMNDVYNAILKPLKKAGLSWKDMREWVYHKRVIEERSDKANPDGWYPERSQKRIGEMQRTDVMERVHKEFWNIRKNFVIKQLKDLGIFSDELMKKIEDNEFYATFSVQDYFNTTYGDNVGPKIYKQYGTLKAIHDPLVATIMKDISLMYSASRIRAVRSVVEFLQVNFSNEVRGADSIKGRIIDPKDPTKTLLVNMYKGTAFGYYVPKEIARSFEQNPFESMIVSRLLRKTIQPFRIAFTEANYGFWLFNVMRDYFRAAGNLPKASVAKFLPEWIRGLKPAFRSVYGEVDPQSQELLREGGIISVASAKGAREEDMQIERLLKKYNIVESDWNNSILRPFGKFFNYYTNAGRALERTTKIASNEWMKKHFPDMSQEERSHTVRSWGGSPDFLKKGAGYALYNNIFMFSNAMKEGFKGDYEAMTRSPAEWWWKKGKYTLIPKMLMYGASIGLLGAGVKEIFDKATEYDKTNYFIIPLATLDNGKAVYIRVPMDESSRLVGGILWKSVNKEFNPMKQGLIDYMAGQAPTVHPILDITADVVQYVSGNNPYDSFRGQYAIPDRVWRANDFRKTEMFAKYLMQKSGTGIIYRFPSGSDVEVKSNIEKVLGYPILSNILGRFIKITDYGEKEKIERDITTPIDEKRSREILNFREAVQKIVVGEMLDAKDQTAIMTEVMRDPNTLPKNVIINLGRRFGTAWTEAYLTASTKEERMAILKALMEKQSK